MTEATGRANTPGRHAAGPPSRRLAVRIVGRPGPLLEQARTLVSSDDVTVTAAGPLPLEVPAGSVPGPAPDDLAVVLAPAAAGFPGMVELVRARGLAHRLVVLSDPADVDPELLLVTLAAGADGWLTTDLSPAAVCRALLAAAAGEPALSRHHVGHLISALRRSGQRTVSRRDGVPVELTNRELDVLAALAAEPTTRAVAGRLVVSEGTVRWHIAQLTRKLRLTTRQELIELAVELADGSGHRLPAPRLPHEARPPDAPAAGPDTGPDPGTDAAFAAGWPALTENERRTVRQVALGLTNNEIAVRHGMSRHTVDSHVKRAFGKLGVRSRVELTRSLLAAEPRAVALQPAELHPEERQPEERQPAPR